MKKYIILLLTIIITSCSPDSFLDVKPTGTVIPKTVEDFDLLLNNYKISTTTNQTISLMDPDVFIPSERFTTITFTPNQQQYKWSDQIFTPSQGDSDYAGKYKYIYVYNLIINYIDDAELGGTKTELDRILIKGEAYAQRAFDYFFLVNEYAPNYSPSTLDVPAIALSINTDLDAQLSRSTVGEVYEQIEKDLAIAEDLLKDAPAMYPDANFRPGSASVAALKAWIALFKGDFEDARINSDKALSQFSYLYDYTQLSNYTLGDAWSGLNTNDFQYSTDNKAAFWSRPHRNTYASTVQFYHQDLLNLFDKNNDQRFKLFSSQKEPFSTTSLSPNWAFATSNFTTQAGIDTQDMLLVSAEARIRTGNAQGALDRINTLLAKRIKNFIPYTIANFTGNEEILQLVKNERRKEFMATGKPWFDLKRYQAYGESISTFTRSILDEIYTLEPGSSKYVVPLAPDILEQNPNLKID